MILVNDVISIFMSHFFLFFVYILNILCDFLCHERIISNVLSLFFYHMMKFEYTMTCLNHKLNYFIIQC